MLQLGEKSSTGKGRFGSFPSLVIKIYSNFNGIITRDVFKRQLVFLYVSQGLSLLLVRLSANNVKSIFNSKSCLVDISVRQAFVGWDF